MPKPRQNATLRKPEIIRHFYDVIASDGIENASIAKVARRVGINPSLIIHYFGNKENMISELVDMVLNQYAGLLRQLPKQTSPAQRFINLLNLIWSPAWQTQADKTVFHSIHAMGSRSTVIGGKIQTLYDAYKKTLIKEMASFVKAGLITVDSPITGAEILMSMSEGSHYFQHYYTLPENNSAHRKEMVKAAMRALGTDPGMIRDFEKQRKVEDENAWTY